MLAPALTQHPGMCALGLCGGRFLQQSFPYSGGNFLTFCASCCNVHSPWCVWKRVRALWGSGVVLFPPAEPAFGPCLLLELCYAVLIPRTQSKDISPREVLPYLPCGPFSIPSHPIVSLSMSLPEILAGSVAVVVGDLQSAPCPCPLQSCLYRCVAAECRVIVTRFLIWVFLGVPVLPELPS